MSHESRDAVLRCLELVALEDEAFAVASDAGVLFHLNHTARAVLEAIQAGASHQDIAEALGTAGRLAPADAAYALDNLLDRIADEFCAARRRPADLPTWPPLAEPVAEAIYRLFDRLICVRYPDQQVAAACHPLLVPMQVPDADRYDLTVSFEVVDQEFVVRCGAASVNVYATPQAAVTGLQRAVLCHDIADPGLFRVVLHAGAIVGPNGAWLIGGESGQGKSTLVARLDAAGCRVFGDDLVPVDLPSRRAQPVPMAMSIKESAWPVVSAFRPELPHAPTSATAIGKRVRYLAPVNPPRDDDRRGQPVAGLLIAHRVQDATPEIRGLSLKQAVIALCDRYGRFPVDPESLRELIALISRLPRYELVYDDATQILPELLTLL